MKIAIVNDTAMAVEALRRVVKSVPAYQVCWVAKDGSEAVHKCINDRPDILLMDLIMPVMDGVQSTKSIMALAPCAIVVVTSTVSGNFTRVYEAMGHGALDAVNTPVLGLDGRLSGADELLAKIATVGRLLGYKTGVASMNVSHGVEPSSNHQSGQSPLIVIGASTGGPQALVDVLTALPKDLTAPIVIVQHVDVAFAEGLATWLRDQSGRRVELAVEGSEPRASVAHLAASNDHLTLTPHRTFHYTEQPKELPYRPSVDVFFRSVAQHWHRPSIGVLLTGMGRDGADGLLTLRKNGWHTIAQDQKSSVVFGMPKAAIELNAAKQILPIDRIASAIDEEYRRLKAATGTHPRAV